MGTIIDEHLFYRIRANLFVFDLEYISVNSDPKNSHIYEIGVVHLQSGDTFECAIYPSINPIPKPFSDAYPTVTHAFLRKRKAVLFHEAFKKLTRFINNHCLDAQNIILMSHNCFKSDKPTLEADCARNGINLPLNWYFLDTLLLARSVMPKQNSYCLEDIYQTVFNSNIKNVHSALADAVALHEIVETFPQHAFVGSTIYPAHSSPLQNVKWLGASSENILFSRNVRSIESLLSNIRDHYSSYSLSIDCSFNAMSLVSFIETHLIQLGLPNVNARSIAESLKNRWV